MAESKHVLKFSTISNFFAAAEEQKLLKRGKNALESKRVRSFHFIPEILMIKGEVHASMRDRIYNVEINLFRDGQIKDVACTCPRGQFVCHHVAAICLYGHYNISVTDVECRWALRKPKEDEVCTIDDIYFSTKKHVSTDRRLTQEERDNFYKSLQKFGSAVGFTWLLRPEPPAEEELLLDIEDLIFSEAYLTSPNKETFFIEKMHISHETIIKVSLHTIGQGRNENWLKCRKNRLTASNFGIVLDKIKKNKYPPYLYKRLTGYYNLENVKAVHCGITHEAQALDEFAAEMGEVTPTGLWLHSCGFLGASPDGLVGEDAIVEIKCPFSFRDKVISDELIRDHSYIVYFDAQGEMQLNQKHEYFHQIQGNLALTGRKVCHLFIWTPRENLLITVEKDEEWENNLQLLQTFYLQKYLPHIICNVFED